MTQNLYATQQSWLAHLQAEFPTYDTNLPEVKDEPTSANGYYEPYVVMRFNDAVKVQTGGSFGGPRHDEEYTLVDCLCVAADPDEARELAYGDGGVRDVLTGYVGVDAGPLEKSGGGQVFTVGDGTSTKPTRYIARVSFRAQVNMTIDE